MPAREVKASSTDVRHAWQRSIVRAMVMWLMMRDALRLR